MTLENVIANNTETLAVCCQTDLENRDDKSSIITIICRICYDNEKDEPIISPCSCKGTVAFVHRSCLETWLAESNTTACELCHHLYKTERNPKYSVKKSLWRWIRLETPNFGFNVRPVRGDILTCTLVTPLAIAITYLCLFSADYYSQKKFTTYPAARWTSLSLFFMVVIILIGYYFWTYMAIKYHTRVWYYWWQRECVVRIPSEQIQFLRPEDYENIRQDDNDHDEQPPQNFLNAVENGPTNSTEQNFNNENQTTNNVENNTVIISNENELDSNIRIVRQNSLGKKTVDFGTNTDLIYIKKHEKSAYSRYTCRINEKTLQN